MDSGGVPNFPSGGDTKVPAMVENKKRASWTATTS